MISGKPRPLFAVTRSALEKQVETDTFRASGPGGQHVNKTLSGVRLHHALSGVVIAVSDTRSQIRNREIAFERLIARLKKLNYRQPVRKPSKVPRIVKKRRLQAKKHRAGVKLARNGRKLMEND